MVSLPTRHHIHSTSIPQDHRPYYIPFRSRGFIVPTHTMTPPSQHSNSRPVCSLSLYCRYRISMWTYNTSKKHRPCWFPSSQVVLVVRVQCPCSGHALPTWSRHCHCPHSTIEPQNTVCVCVAHGALSPTRLDRLTLEACLVSSTSLSISQTSSALMFNSSSDLYCDFDSSRYSATYSFSIIRSLFSLSLPHPKLRDHLPKD